MPPGLCVLLASLNLENQIRKKVTPFTIQPREVLFAGHRLCCSKPRHRCAIADWAASATSVHGLQSCTTALHSPWSLLLRVQLPHRLKQPGSKKGTPDTIIYWMPSMHWRETKCRVRLLHLTSPFTFYTNRQAERRELNRRDDGSAVQGEADAGGRKLVRGCHLRTEVGQDLKYFKSNSMFLIS